MIEQYLGIDQEYILIGVCALAVILFIIMIVQAAKLGSLKKKYAEFMKGKSGESLEEILMEKINKIDELDDRNRKNEQRIDQLAKDLEPCYQKIGLEKYDALDEQGGKLSFALTLLDEKNNGFIINTVHSREGSYSYIKEIIDGNSIIGLSPEEETALSKALNGTN
ncbi:MAG: DUF4446 family protein [Lachnospiraceae bacterium]|jgi:hypothetical protein|nr:DUF4446 family protein [Lachnospiraceae bacterium]MDY3990741.1 DUF4446 family protein [Lachnospiraceae bacterium]